MPLLHIPRRSSRTEGPLTLGTQTVEGTLRINGPLRITLNNDVYSQTGQYVLFQYNTLTIPSVPGTYATNDAALAALLTPYAAFADPVNTLSAVGSIVDDPAKNRILLNLTSNPYNGTQFVEGDLDISGPLVIVMNSALYASAGDYVLFDVTGTVSPGSLDHISLSLPRGRRIDTSVAAGPRSVARVGGGTQIKVALL